MNYITLEAEITEIGRSGMINIDFAQGDDRATDSGKEASGYKLGTFRYGNILRYCTYHCFDAEEAKDLIYG